MAGHPHFPFLGLPTSVPMKRPHTYIEDEREYSVLKTPSAKKRPDLATLANEFAAADRAAKEAEWFGHMMCAVEFRETGGDEEAHGANEPPEPRRRWKGGQQPRRPGLEMDAMVWGEGDGYMPNMSGIPGMPGMPGMHYMHGMHDMAGMPSFRRAASGVTQEFPCHVESKEMDYFCAFFDEDLVNYICHQSNRFQEMSIDFGKVPKTTKKRRWSPLEVPEYYVFMALLLLMAHVKKHVIKEYWITNDLVSTPAFGKYMARDRFTEILRFLHFTDVCNPIETDKLWKVRPVLSVIKDKFLRFFGPFRNVHLDGSITLYRGRLLFRQYTSSNRRCFGIKVFVICDSDSEYILDALFYPGTDGDMESSDPIGFSGAAVKEFVDRYFGENHFLYSERFNPPPALTKYLREHDTGSCGSVKVNDKHWPKTDGDKQSRLNIDRSSKMLAIRWLENRPMNTNIGQAGNVGDSHKAGSSNKGKKAAVKDDSDGFNMKVADESAMQVGDVECVRKCLKWHKKIFLLLFDITMMNAYKLFLLRSGKHPSLRAFSKKVIEQLLEKYYHPLPSVPRRHVAKTPRLAGRDYISKHHIIPNGKKQRRRCYVCYHTKRRQTAEKRSGFHCNECKVSLCVTPCFMEYHTLKDL